MLTYVTGLLKNGAAVREERDVLSPLILLLPLLRLQPESDAGPFQSVFEKRHSQAQPGSVSILQLGPCLSFPINNEAQSQ